MTALLEVNRLSKRFCREPKRAVGYALRDIANDIIVRGPRNKLRAGEFWALKDVNFRVEAGEVVGVIGNNGAGKSTLLSLVTGILKPTVGRISTNARNVVTMGNQTDLNPVQTGRENIANKLAFYGMSDAEIAQNIQPVIDFAELGPSIDSAAGTYSLGMRVRLSFAIYTRLRPDLLVVDEGLNGGDINFYRKFGSFLEQYIEAGGTILLASHNLPEVQLLCHKCILMEQGQVISVGKPREVIDTYYQLNEKAPPELSSRLPRKESSSLAQYLGLSNSEENGDVVHFQSVDVTAADGANAFPGGPAHIEIVCHSREEVGSAICALEIGSAAIFPLSVLATRCSLKKGRNVLRCTVDRLPLVPGDYNASLLMANGKVGSMLGFAGHADRPIQFKVAAQPDELNNIARFRKSPVYLSASWSCDGQAEL